MWDQWNHIIAAKLNSKILLQTVVYATKGFDIDERRLRFFIAMSTQKRPIEIHSIC